MSGFRWKCTACGKNTSRSESLGRPEPGNCPRKKKRDGTYGPHSWVKNGKY